jgi:succinoglycan biosynthesis protein ExoM
MKAARENLSIDICICTFRRPELAATLRSLAAMDMPSGYRIGIIVADNDDAPTAAPLVAQLATELDLPIRYRHSPARNISIARNACLDASSADFATFIDDDETASPQWLARLVSAMEATDADAVLGPVRARYAPEAPDWMKKGDFHSTRPVSVGGEIRTGYTCNVLLRMGAPSISGRRFSLARGQSGGEDTEFFDHVYKAGGKIGYAADAWVDEVVGSERATLAWLARRRFRAGQTHGRLMGGDAAGMRAVKHLALASSKLAYCLSAAAVSAWRPTARNRSLLRGMLHLGVLSGLVGGRELRLYGTTPSREGGNRAA